MACDCLINNSHHLGRAKDKYFTTITLFFQVKTILKVVMINPLTRKREETERGK